MTNKKAIFSAPAKSKIKQILLIILLIGLVAYFIPLPIPRWQTMTGECLRHGETVEVKVRMVELKYLLKDDTIYGKFWLSVNGEKEQFRTDNNGGTIELWDSAIILKDGTIRKDGKLQEYYISTGGADYVNRYHIIVNRSRSCWVMDQYLDKFFVNQEGGYTVPKADSHLLIVSKDGDTDAARQEMTEVIDYFELIVRADE